MPFVKGHSWGEVFNKQEQSMGPYQLQFTTVFSSFYFQMSFATVAIQAAAFVCNSRDETLLQAPPKLSIF